MEEKFDFNVHKIGGAGLMQDRNDLLRLTGKIVRDNDRGVIIFVVSAFATVTRLLGTLFQAIEYHQDKEVSEIISKFKKIHSDAIERLILRDSEYFKEKSSDLIHELEAFTQGGCLLSIKDHSRILTFGERYSSLIFNQFLNESFDSGSRLLDARNFIFGEGGDYLNSTLVMPSTTEEICYCFANELNSGKVKIITTQGYIACDNRVLGYDGSDLTAAVITLALLKWEKKISLTYWKDIPGVMKNPLNPKEGIFDEMNVTDYIEFSNRESVPVRADAIGLLVFSNSENLQIFINSFKDLDRLGTIIRS